MSLRPAIPLRRALTAWLGPVAFLVLAVVTVSAPVAYLAVGARTVRSHASEAAVQVAEALRAEIQEQPLLWRYNTIKILAHLRAHTHAEVVRIEVTDARGVPIDLGVAEQPSTAEDLVWASAPIHLGSGDEPAVAEVWVGATLAEVQREALILLGTFALLAAGLSGLTYWLPVRAVGAAERHIVALVARLRESQHALEQLNTALERQVEERSSQLRRALDELQEKEQGLRELSGRAAEQQEAERRALARDLHDSAGQAMTAIRINLQLISQRTDSPDLTRLAQRTVEIADATLEDVRRIVDRLGPSVLDDMGLAAAVERYCENFGERTAIAVERRVDCPGRHDRAVETACYRTVQEALTNVARHAAARRVELSLVARSSGIELAVTDDGRGFVPGDERHRGRRGLTGMRERADLLGGTLELRSAPDRGTTVRLWLPLGPRAATIA